MNADVDGILDGVVDADVEANVDADAGTNERTLLEEPIESSSEYVVKDCVDYRINQWTEIAQPQKYLENNLEIEKDK